MIVVCHMCLLPGVGGSVCGSNVSLKKCEHKLDCGGCVSLQEDIIRQKDTEKPYWICCDKCCGIVNKANEECLHCFHGKKCLNYHSLSTGSHCLGGKPPTTATIQTSGSSTTDATPNPKSQITKNKLKGVRFQGDDPAGK